MRLKQGVRVLALPGDAIQVGVAPGLVLDSLTRAERTFVESLEGGRESRSGDHGPFALIGSQLRQHGLTEPNPPPPWIASLDDAGAVGAAIARVLAASSWIMSLDDPRPAAAAPSGTFDAWQPGDTCAAALAADLGSRGGHVLGPEHHPHLSILVGDGALALEKAIPLMASDSPHLFVTTDESGATVGPLVVPGSTACGLCASLWRAESQPHWPVLALQLTAPGSARAHADAVTASLIAGLAGLAAHALRSSLDGVAGSQWRIENTGVTHAQVPAHPHCGCGAFAGDSPSGPRSARRYRESAPHRH